MELTPSLRQACVRLVRGNRTAFALVVFALGSTLGAVVCALGFTHLVTSQPLPYPQQERLVVAEQVILDHGENSHSRAFSFPAAMLLHGQSQDILASAVIIDHTRDIALSHPAQPLVSVSYTTTGYAELFAPPMALGRFPGENAGAGGAQPVAVISHSAWRTLFDMREDVLGLSVRTAAGTDFEVVGVTARDFVEPEFHGPGYRTDVWLPWEFNSAPRQWGWAATTDTLTLAGRLLPEVGAQQAGERLSLLLNARWREELGASSGSRAGWSTRVELTDARRAIAGSGLAVGPLLLAGTLGLVLITLVNVTHLLVARVAEREREFSIQRALGAGSKHLFGQVLADILLLMLPAAVVALLVAMAGFALMQHFLGSMLPRLDELSIGWQSVILTLVSVVALAVPLATIALASTGRASANGGLIAGRHGTAANVSRRLRTVLMASQVGVAGLLIIVTFGLFREAYRIVDERGIDLERSSSAYLYESPSAAQDEASRMQRLGEVRRRLAELPGVENISQSHSPLQDFIRTAVVSGRSGAQYPVELKRIDHEYLGITGQALALGRNFSAADVQQSADVALVNAPFAKLLQRERGVLGTQLSRGNAEGFTVVGVVDELAYPGAAAGAPRIYLPASGLGSNFILRFKPGQHLSRAQLVKFVTEVDPDLGVFLYDDLDRQRADILLPRRLTAISTLVVVFLVLLVSGMGLYGMVRYTTRLARAEIGARLAFGARSRHIILLLVSNNLAAVASGCVAGAAVALLVLPAIRARFDAHLFDLRWVDAAVALGSLGLLALLACYLSARPLLSQPPAVALHDAGR